MAELDKATNVELPGPRVGKKPPVKPNVFEGQELVEPSIPMFLRTGELVDAVLGGDNFAGAVRRTQEYTHRLGKNGIGTAFTDGFPADPAYDVLDDPYYEQYPQLFDAMADSKSREQTREIVREYEATREAAFVLAQDPRGTAASMMALIADPTLLIAAPKVIQGASFLKRTGKAFGVTMGVSLPVETLISSENPQRTFSEGLAIATTISLFAAPVLALGGRHRPREEPIEVGFPKGEGVRIDKSMFGPETARATEHIPINTRGINEEPLTGVNASHVNAPKDLGSAATPGARTTSFTEELAEEAFVATGVKLEDIPWNPLFRLNSSPSVMARSVSESLADSGLIRNKNLKFKSSDVSVETTTRVRWSKPLIDALKATDDQFLLYRNKALGSELGNQARVMRTALEDALPGATGGKLTAKQFREEIATAMRNGDTHHIPEVQASARANRPLLDKLKKDAFEQDLFTRQMRREVGILERRVAVGQSKVTRLHGEAKKEAIDELADVMADLSAVEEKIKRLNEFGPTVNSAETYFPRYWNKTAIVEGRAELRTIVEDWLIRQKNVEPHKAATEADEIIDNLLMESAYFDLKASEKVTERAEASAFRERTLDIDDNLVKDFLVNDVETVMRHHTRTVGMDIELTAKFGDIDMKKQIDMVTEEYVEIIKNAPASERAALRKQHKRDVRDIEALRDRNRGTYGVPEDPFRLLSRSLRIAKSFNVLTMMGGAAITSTSDVARLVMVDGFGDSLKVASRMLKDPVFRKMARAETREAGQAMDQVLGTRAMQMADIADNFGNRMGVEKALLGSAQVMFTVNGLNTWNTMMKEVASVMTANRMNRAVSAVGQKSATSKQISNLAASGIDENMALRISDELGKYGDKVGDLHLPNTSLWDDANAAFHYRAAISQDVDRVIVTPGAGDRALWTSTEWGSTIAQFKSFGQAFFQRGIVRGLQEPDVNLLIGTGALIGMGFLVNEVKGAIRGGQQKKSMGVKIMDAVDRSGALGWVTDADNALEVISNGRLGLRPFTGTGGRPSKLRDMGRVLGPSFSTAANVADTVGSTLQGSVNTKAARNLTPFQNHPVSQLGRQAIDAFTRPTSPKEN
jgi:hypothetical protein